MKKKKHAFNKRTFTVLMAMLLAFLSACEKETVLPGDGREAYVNFYTAADAVLQGNLTQQNYIYINDSLAHPDYAQFPVFSASADDFRTYPRYPAAALGVSDEIVVPIGTPYQTVYWMPVENGNYRFIFTSANKVYLHTNEVTLEPKSHMMQCLVESLEADDAYRVVNVPIEPKGTKGKVRIQIVNLSPDAGALDVKRTDRSGNQLPDVLPASLGFGEYSTYAEIDTTGSADTNGQILLRIRKHQTDKELMMVAVPAIPYSSFTVLFQGFENATERRVKTGDNQYQSIQVQPNLRVNLRRVY